MFDDGGVQIEQSCQLYGDIANSRDRGGGEKAGWARIVRESRRPWISSFHRCIACNIGSCEASKTIIHESLSVLNCREKLNLAGISQLSRDGESCPTASSYLLHVQCWSLTDLHSSSIFADGSCESKRISSQLSQALQKRPQASYHKTSDQSRAQLLLQNRVGQLSLQKAFSPNQPA